MRSTTLLAQLLLLVAASIAPAEQDHPCRTEVERLCPGVEPGDGRIRDCMRAHRLELSPDCRARFEERRALRLEQGARILLACKEDIEALCREVPIGEGRWRRCLTDNVDRLSAACRDLLDLATP
jgi:hypothetical protein